MTTSQVDWKEFLSSSSVLVLLVGFASIFMGSSLLVMELGRRALWQLASGDDVVTILRDPIVQLQGSPLGWLMSAGVIVMTIALVKECSATREHA